MPFANTLTLRVTHTGLTQSSIYINDIHDGKDQNGRVNNRKPPQYVPVGGYIDMLYTEQVHYSYDHGMIRNLITQGLVTTEFLGVVGGALEVVSGTSLWNFNPYNNQELNGNVDDRGIRLNAKNSNGFIDMFYHDNNHALYVVCHQPTDPQNLGEMDDADIRVYSSNGIKVQNGENWETTDGGEIYLYTGQGYNSNITDVQGTDGGFMYINLGRGGDFQGNGGSFTLTAGDGGNGGIDVDLELDRNGGNGGDISFTSGEGGGNGGNGGNISLTTGDGNGNGYQAGDIIIDPGTGFNNAVNGQVVLYNEIRVPDYANGVMTVTNGNGLVQTKGGSGQVTQAINGNQNNATFAVGINTSLCIPGSIIVVTIEVSDPDVHITAPPYIRNKVNGYFEVVFNAENINVAGRNMYLNYIIL